MKDEINDLRMESGSTVCSEAGTGVELGSGTFSRPPPLISRCNVQEGWRSKDGLQIFQKVVFKGIIDDEVLMLVSDLEKMVPRKAHKCRFSWKTHSASERPYRHIHMRNPNPCSFTLWQRWTKLTWTGTRKPIGSALPSKMQDKAHKKSGQVQNIEQNENTFPTTWRIWDCS